VPRCNHLAGGWRGAVGPCWWPLGCNEQAGAGHKCTPRACGGQAAGRLQNQPRGAVSSCRWQQWRCLVVFLHQLGSGRLELCQPVVALKRQPAESINSEGGQPLAAHCVLAQGTRFVEYNIDHAVTDGRTIVPPPGAWLGLRAEAACPGGCAHDSSHVDAFPCSGTSSILRSVRH